MNMPPHHNMATTSDHDDHDMEHSMQMYFTADCEVTILFEGWKTETCLHLFGSCMVVILAAILFEGIRYLRKRMDQLLIWKLKGLLGSSSQLDPHGNHPDSPDQDHIIISSSRKKLLARFHVLQSILYLLQLLLGYLLMLVAMTFNVWLFLCVCLGASFGHLCFYFIDVFRVDGFGATEPKMQEGGHCHCG